MKNTVFVDSKMNSDMAEHLKARFAIDAVTPQAMPHDARFLLTWLEGVLRVVDQLHPEMLPFHVELVQPESRLQSLKRDALIKAVGCPAADHKKTIFDATAGWARDACLFAYSGYTVKFCERNPVIAALTDNGLQRFAEVQPALAARMRLLHADALALLADTAQMRDVDVIYLDPMYPDHAYRAQVKKAAQILRALTEAMPQESISDQQWLQAALATKVKRIVVKRPLRAPIIAGSQPHHQIIAKTVRFDVYAG